MKRILAATAIAGLVVFLLIQLVPYGHGQTNPPATQEVRWDSPATAELVDGACYDCHSNHTRRPWYSKIAPMSWLIRRDVDAGRDELNFSEMDREDNELDKVLESVQDGEMPPLPYKLLHKDARLSDAEAAALIAGLQRSLPAEDEDRGNGGPGRG